MAVTGPRGVSNAAADTPLQARRKYDYSDKIIFREFESAPLLTILSRRMQKRAVSDIEFRTWEDGYPALSAVFTDNASAAISTTVTRLDSDVDPTTWVQVGDIIHFRRDDPNQSNDSCYEQGENMIVVGLTATYVDVTRNNGAGGTATYGVTTATDVGLKGYLMPAAQKSGSNDPESLTQAIEYETNYIQNLREAWEIDWNLEATDMYGESDKTRIPKKKRKTFMRKAERMLLLGQKRTSFDGDSPKNYAQGVIPFITAEQTAASGLRAHVKWATGTTDLVNGTAALSSRSRVWRVGDVTANFTWEKLMEASFYLFRYGGSTKYLFSGTLLSILIQEILMKYVRWEPMKELFGMNVATLSIGARKIVIIEDRELDEMGYALDGVLLDLDYVGYVYQKGHDIQVNSNIQSPGAHTSKDELYGYLSTDGNFWEAHSFITGITGTGLTT